MKILKSRTVLGVICIVASLLDVYKRQIVTWICLCYIENCIIQCQSNRLYVFVCISYFHAFSRHGNSILKIQGGKIMASCEICGEEMLNRVGCTVGICDCNGKSYPRIDVYKRQGWNRLLLFLPSIREASR